MVLNKVEICGVNTAKLPLLSDGEKEVLFEKIKAGDEEAKEQYTRGKRGKVYLDRAQSQAGGLYSQKV